MRRLALVVALAAVAVSLMGASAAWGDTITAMCTTGQTTQPCAGGWYTTPILELSWDWTAGGTPSNCNESSYQTDSVATVSCTVSWTDGFTGTQSYTVHVETSSPTATATPSRRPRRERLVQRARLVHLRGQLVLTDRVVHAIDDLRWPEHGRRQRVWHLHRQRREDRRDR